MMSCLLYIHHSFSAMTGNPTRNCCVKIWIESMSLGLLRHKCLNQKRYNGAQYANHAQLLMNHYANHSTVFSHFSKRNACSDYYQSLLVVYFIIR